MGWDSTTPQNLAKLPEGYASKLMGLAHREASLLVEVDGKLGLHFGLRPARSSVAQAPAFDSSFTASRPADGGSDDRDHLSDLHCGCKGQVL